MEITKKWLDDLSACSDGVKWWLASKEIDSKKVVEKLMAENKFAWANWLIVRLFDRPQGIKYAIFAAEQVIDIFEKKYPDDKRPRLAIEAAKKVLGEDTEENRDAAEAAAADAIYAADDAADAANAAIYAAIYAANTAYAAYAAIHAANAAIYAANATYAAYADDAADAATYAIYAANAGKKKLQKIIINYGLSLLEVKMRNDPA